MSTTSDEYRRDRRLREIKLFQALSFTQPASLSIKEAAVRILLGNLNKWTHRQTMQDRLAQMALSEKRNTERNRRELYLRSLCR